MTTELKLGDRDELKKKLSCLEIISKNSAHHPSIKGAKDNVIKRTISESEYFFSN